MADKYCACTKIKLFTVTLILSTDHRMKAGVNYKEKMKAPSVQNVRHVGPRVDNVTA